MRPDDWHLTEDADEFLDRAGEFIRSRLAQHTTLLTVTEKLRTQGTDAYGGQAPVFGLLERAGEVLATCHRVPGRPLSIASLAPEHAGSLAVRMTERSGSLPGASGPQDSVAAFVVAWQQRTGAAPALRHRLRLYRLATLVPPEPLPAGRGRPVGEQERERLMCWVREFTADVGEDVSIDAGSWDGTRFAGKRYTFWETPEGTPVSLAGRTSPVAGQIRVDPVYTPAGLRGRGYAGAVTAEVSREALEAGASEVVLFADRANATSNALYQRLGYVPVSEVAVYDFTGGDRPKTVPLP